MFWTLIDVSILIHRSILIHYISNQRWFKVYTKASKNEGIKCVHRHEISHFEENYRLALNVIHVTVPKRTRMESSTYRGDRFNSLGRRTNLRARRGPGRFSLVVGLLRVYAGKEGISEEGKKRTKRVKGNERVKSDSQCTPPGALFRFIFSVDISPFRSRS